MLELAASGLLFLIVSGTVSSLAHRWLAYGVKLAPALALSLSLATGIGAGVVTWWLTNQAWPSDCIDFTPDPSGRC